MRTKSTAANRAWGLQKKFMRRQDGAESNNSKSAEEEKKHRRGERKYDLRAGGSSRKLPHIDKILLNHTKGGGKPEGSHGGRYTRGEIIDQRPPWGHFYDTVS